MKTGLAIEDIPRRKFRESWAADMVRNFYESGDQVWELEAEDLPSPDKAEQHRMTLYNAMSRYGSGKASKRGESIFLIRGDS